MLFISMRSPHFFSFLLLLLISCCFFIAPSNAAAAIAKADVGVILDYDTSVGKICKTCISMAIEDFNSNPNHSTMIVPHFRDSRSDVVAAASAAVDLLKNVQVMAILGPQQSIQADFVIKIGNKSQVPIISPATSPALSPKQSQYFIRSAWCTSYQVRAIAAFIKNFSWREVVFVYEDTNYGSGLVPFWTEDLQESNALISYQSAISPACSDHQLREHLSSLKKMQTRVFVVHMMPDLASRFFKLAKEAGMMNKEYAWIIADMLTSFLDSMDSETIEAMHGVIGVKGYTPEPNDELNAFTSRWSKRFLKDNPDMNNTILNVFGLWAYDSITALADSIERVGMASPQFNTSVDGENLSDVEAIGTSSTGESLATLMRNFSSKGLSGDFNITDGQLQPSAFEIVNVIGKTEIAITVGFWTEQCGISKELKPEDNQVDCSTEEETLKAIVWPGKQDDPPKGWEISTRRKFKVGVPEKGGFPEFIKFEMNRTTKAVEPTGFSISVFKAAWENMPYDVPVPEYVRFTGGYDDLVKKISSKVFDAVVGDVTVTADRSEFADFAIPYSESGVAIVVPIKHDERKNAWIFMKPLSSGLWLTIGAFFVFTGLVVWTLEHRVNKEFRGSPKEQVGMIFWFSFSTLVFAHKEKVKSNLSRFVLIIWMFAVMVLTTSYTANLTSMLTVDQLQPKFSNIDDLKKDGVYVGFQKGSFVQKFLTTTMEFDGSKLINYSTVEEFDEALTKGSKGGGVDAIVDELPYIRLFLSKYCDKYTIIDQTYPTSGLGFAFPKGSPLVPDVSRAILNLTENNKMAKFVEALPRDENRCTNTNGAQITSQKLGLDSFKGLFLIAGLSSSLALAIFISTFLYENRYILTSTASKKEKIQGLATSFYRGKDEPPSSKESPAPDDGGRVSSATSIACDTDEMFSQNEGIEITFMKPA